MIRSLAGAFAVAAWLLGAAPLFAQDYPRSAINMVIPLAPGDTADIAARIMGQELSRELKVPVVAVNRPGGGGVVGTESVVKAKNDGYTIVFTNNAALIFRPVLDPKIVTYDAEKDLVPLGLATRSPSVLAVRGDAPFKDFRELVEFSKKNPGKVRVGTAGAGTVGDYCIRVINSLTDAGITMVPFTGASPAVNSLLGGHVEGVVLALGTLSGQMKTGVLRGVVMSSKVPEFPVIPTMTELGYARDIFGIWISFLAPAGVPADVVKALVPAIERAVKSPGAVAKLTPLGIVQDYSPPDRLLAEIREERGRVQEMAAKAGLEK